MDSLDIKTGGMEVLFSGSLITFGLGETRLDLHHNGEDLSIIFEFIDESEKDAEMKRTFEVINETLGKFCFYNYKSEVGAYPREPFSLGTIGGKDLLLQYRIDDLKSKSKLLFYTFYLGQEV